MVEQKKKKKNEPDHSRGTRDSEGQWKELDYRIPMDLTANPISTTSSCMPLSRTFNFSDSTCMSRHDNT